MIPDTLAIAPFYTDALALRWRPRQLPGVGRVQRASRMEPKERYLPDGAIFAGSASRSRTPIRAKIKEYVEHSWFDS